MVSRNIDPCRGDPAINWCSTSTQNSSSAWWNGKIQSLSNEDQGKQVILKVDPASDNATLGFHNATLVLPFLCKV
jgi:hypothetical protein